ncbi:hypothetical protein [Dietzia massiliensis]|uniref:hypothetical protein n=1 Tax=Dietzia massiliensis TaxID=2697499 RepID=UPI001BD15C0B|nr:hypothetical protein [Dietzia massiliensis]MBS7548302.1 hypothetical protein [Dietzia massiliensis]
MKFTTTSLRKLVALFSALLVVVGIGAVVRNVEPTEATWADQVRGESRFGMANPYAGNAFARAVSTYGFLDRATFNGSVDGSIAFRRAPDLSRDAPRASTHWSTGLLGFLPLTTVGQSCATLSASAQCESGSSLGVENPKATAVSEAKSLDLTASLGGLDLVTYQSDNPLRAIATCSATESSAFLSQTGPEAGAGSIILGRNGIFSEEVRLPVPAPNTVVRGHRAWGAYDYTARLWHVREVKPGYALSQLRLRVAATGTAGAERWNLDLILAHAECGVGHRTTDAPGRPTTSDIWPADSPRASRLATSETHAAADPTAEVAEEAGAEPDGVDDIPDAGASSDAEKLPAATDTDDVDQISDKESVLSPEEEAATTVPTRLQPLAIPAETTNPTAPEGPQDLEAVRVGREFAVVNREGVELGTARIDDIVRTPGCGVELTLSIRTSAGAGPDRWASIGPGDFSEIRPGGAIRRAGTVSSDCEQAANSKTTALSTGREYEIVIAIALDDSAQQAMLRPDGTAGWFFDLPPLPKVTATTSPSAPTPTSSPTTAPGERSVETPVNTAAA